MNGDYDDGSAAAAQSNIRNIVSMVKSGKLNKSEAFNELRYMLKNPSSHGGGQFSMPADSREDTPAHESFPSSPELPKQASVSTTPRFSKEDRRLLINKLIEKKRQDRLAQSYEDGNMEAEEFQSGQYDDYPEQPRMDHSEENFERRLSRSSSHGGDRGEEFGHRFRDGGDASSISSSAGIRSRSLSRDRPQSAGRSGSRQHFRSAPLTRRAMDDFHMDDLRGHKIVQDEAAIRADMFKECTFTPRVKPLPASYGPPKDKDTQFYERVMRWQREKAIESERRQNIAGSSEVEGCTFKPKINRNSARAVKMNRGEPKKDTAIRLYESSALTAEQKSKFIEDEQQREQRAQAQECTFQPRLATKKSGFSYVETKYDKVKVPTIHEEAEIPKPMPKECTFTPKIKGVTRNMSSAKLYVNMDVVERLTKPVPVESQEDDERHFDVASSYDRDRPVMDVAQFMGTLQQNGSPPSNFQTPGERRRPSSAPRTGRASLGGVSDNAPVDELTAEEKEARRQSFKAFLGRQTQTLIRKDKKTEELVRSSTPGFTPSVNRRSIRMAEQTKKGDFLNRVQQDVLRREQVTSKISAQTVDSECSFKPELSRRSQKMRPRSVYEMSRGDLHKKETKSRILRLKTEQEELKNLTFQPHLSASKSRKARSSLQLVANPGGFLERHTLEMQQKELERVKYQESRAEEEMKECHFVPEITECPAYVKRIAKSLAVVKAARSQEEPLANSKPQWK